MKSIGIHYLLENKKLFSATGCYFKMLGLKCYYDGSIFKDKNIEAKFNFIDVDDDIISTPTIAIRSILFSLLAHKCINQREMEDYSLLLSFLNNDLLYKINYLDSTSFENLEVNIKDYEEVNTLYLMITNHFSNKKIGVNSFYLHSLYYSLYLLTLVNKVALKVDVEPTFKSDIVPDIAMKIDKKSKSLKVDPLQIDALCEVSRLSLKMNSKIND